MRDVPYMLKVLIPGAIREQHDLKSIKDGVYRIEHEKRTIDVTMKKGEVVHTMPVR